MGAFSAQQYPPVGTKAAAEWAEISAAAPQMAVTMTRYLDQASTFLAPASVDVANNTLRQLAQWLIDNTNVDHVAGIGRDHIEDFKLWLAERPGNGGGRLSLNTQRQRLRMIRMFFERIIDWEWSDTPARNPIIGRDIPPRPEPLPKFLDDRDAAKLMAAARATADHLVVEFLARTGLRSGELCDLEVDSVVKIGEAFWLRVPLGKLRNDRYVPLHPQLVDLLAEWTATNLDHIRRHHRLVADHRGPLKRHRVRPIVKRVGRACGVTVHPHQLRHTLATQAINRGMRLEAIATFSGTAQWP
jgi:integrase